MKRIPKINLSNNLETQNRFIIDNLKHRLIDYFHVVAEILIESFWGNSIRGMKETDIKNELNDIKTIRNSILKTLRNYLREYPVSRKYEELRSQKEKTEFIIDEYTSDLFFFLFDKREKILNTNTNSKYRTKIGRPIENKFKVASIWAFTMKRNNEISWTNIVRLLQWFHKYLIDTNYADELKTRDDIKKEARYFKDQCQLITEKHSEILKLSSRSFFLNPSHDKIPSFLHSIIFEKRSIEVNKIFKKYPLIFKTKMEFINNKKYFSQDWIPLPSKSKIEPFIVFPNGNIFRDIEILLEWKLR